MTKLSKPDLLQVVVEAIAESGWNVLYLDDQHPFRLQIYNDTQRFRVRIYIWNITHGGGRARPANEYRIQITGLKVNQFIPEPDGKTLILGWWDEASIFAGFDYSRHSGLLGASPSFQIHEECLHQAYENGFSPCLKENQEIAIAFRPDFLVEYIANMEGLHEFGNSEHDFAVLQQVANAPELVNDADLQTTQRERKVVIASVQKKLRDSSFRKRVLTAYGHRCAFCGLQLDLVQAAYIVPVNYEGSTDETYNGIAACFLHHAAYDYSLITFDESYKIVVHPEKARRLTEIKRDGGLDAFRTALKPLIILPPAISDRPHREFVRLANQIRGW